MAWTSIWSSFTSLEKFVLYSLFYTLGPFFLIRSCTLNMGEIDSSLGRSILYAFPPYLPRNFHGPNLLICNLLGIPFWSLALLTCTITQSPTSNYKSFLLSFTLDFSFWFSSIKVLQTYSWIYFIDWENSSTCPLLSSWFLNSLSLHTPLGWMP